MKEKRKKCCYRQSKITPRARACPLAPSRKSEKKRWDKKGNRQLHCVVSLNHPSFCFSPALPPQRWLQAVTGISNTLVAMPLLTGVPGHWQWFVQNRVPTLLCMEKHSVFRGAELPHGGSCRGEHRALTWPIRSTQRAQSGAWVRLLSRSELARFSLPCICIKSTLITLNKSTQGPSSSAVRPARAELTQPGYERSNTEKMDERKGSPSTWLHSQAR